MLDFADLVQINKFTLCGSEDAPRNVPKPWELLISGTSAAQFTNNGANAPTMKAGD